MKGLYIFDAEADGLLDDMTHFHCILFKAYGEKKFYLFLDEKHEEYGGALQYAKQKAVGAEAELIVRDFSEVNAFLSTEPRAIACHNMFGYDLRAFKKFLGTKYDMFEDKKCMGMINGKQVSMFDTLSMSRTLYPDRPLPKGCPDQVFVPALGRKKKVGPHGLEAWGMRVANLKVSIDDWRGLPLWKYVDRCWEDVVINELVWQRLVQEASGKDNPDDKRFYYGDKPDRLRNQMINWKDSLRRGMLADYLMIEQEIQGVCFDEESAIKLRDYCDKTMAEIEADVEPQLPKKELSPSARPTFPAAPFKADGTISTHGWSWLKRLDYPVNQEALDYKDPPKTSFKANGEVSKAGETFCNKAGITDPELYADYLREMIDRGTSLSPLPPDLMEQAIQDLRDRKEPSFMVEMKISNQKDIKEYLIRDAGWKPTVWRLKDVTKDQFKKQRNQFEIDDLVNQYIDWLAEVCPHRGLILKELGLTEFQFKDREKMFKFFVRKARGLPTTAKFKDDRGQLCENLEKVQGDLAKQIVKWLSLRNRRSVLDPMKEDKVDTGLLNHPRLRIDGKLPARANGITNTGRRKHSICANMPKPDPKVLLGKEMRALWGVPEGKYQVGIDGSNLEGMIAAWGAYEFDGGEYLRIMESGDAHARNAKAYSIAAGVEVTRNGGKGVTYGIMYGAQAAKISAMLGISLEKAQAVIDAFWDSNFGLKGRREALEKFWEATGKRFIYGIDGRKIWTRSKHSLLNAYQQNGGASLFDLVGILFHYAIKNNGMYDDGVRRTIYYHAEYQIEVPEKYKKKFYFDTLEEADSFVKEFKAQGKHLDGHKHFKVRKDENKKEVLDENGNPVRDPVLNADGKIEIIYCPVGELVVKCIEKAAKMQGSPVHITGEYLTGYNWADCH